MTVQTLTTKKNQKGFTLIELLVVIGILAILLAITLIAINPARQFGQANDTKRRSDATQILNAIGQYTASNGGILPAEVTSNSYGVANDQFVEIDVAHFPNMCAQLVPTYISALPMDPTLANSQAGVPATGNNGCTPTAPAVANWDTGYKINKDANNRITIQAPNAYAGPIQVTR